MKKTIISLITLVLFIISCKKDDQSTAGGVAVPSVGKQYVYTRQNSELKVWANKKELSSNSYQPEDFFSSDDLDFPTDAKIVLSSNGKAVISSGQDKDTATYIITRDTLKIYIDFLQDYYPLGLYKNNEIQIKESSVYLVKDGNETNKIQVTNSDFYNVEDALGFMGYNNLLNMGSKDTIAICNTSYYLTRKY